MGTIIMEASKVIEAANAVIDSILDERKKRYEETITRIMKEKYFSFRRGSYTMTREEAIKEINNSEIADLYSHNRYAWGDLAYARKLLKLATHGDPVTLNENDTAVLF